MAEDRVLPFAGAARTYDRAGYAVRHIGLQDLREALRAGYDDFSADPTHKIFVSLIYPILGLVLFWAASQRNLLPLIFPLLSGFALLGPFLALGIYEISRCRERGEVISHRRAFNIFRYECFGSIILMGAILASFFFAWLALAMILFNLTIGTTPASVGEFLTALFATSEGWTLIVLGNAVGFVFAVIVLAISVVSFPLIIDRHTSAGTAILTSVDAVVRNPGPMAVWGLIVGGLLVLGSIPFLVGLAVVLPILGHATWHLYRKVVV